MSKLEITNGNEVNHSRRAFLQLALLSPIALLTSCNNNEVNVIGTSTGKDENTYIDIDGTPTPSPYPTFGVQTTEPTEALPTIEAILPTIEKVTATVVNARKTNTPVALIPDLQNLPSDLTPITELTPLNETRFTGCKEIINISGTQWTDKDPLIQAIVTFVCTTQDGGQAKVTVWVPRGLNNPAVGWEVLGETRDGEKHTILFKNGVKAKVRSFRNL